MTAFVQKFDDIFSPLDEDEGSVEDTQTNQRTCADIRIDGDMYINESSPSSRPQQFARRHNSSPPNLRMSSITGILEGLGGNRSREARYCDINSNSDAANEKYNSIILRHDAAISGPWLGPWEVLMLVATNLEYINANP